MGSRARSARRCGPAAPRRPGSHGRAAAAPGVDRPEIVGVERDQAAQQCLDRAGRAALLPDPAQDAERAGMRGFHLQCRKARHFCRCDAGRLCGLVHKGLHARAAAGRTRRRQRPTRSTGRGSGRCRRRMSRWMRRQATRPGGAQTRVTTVPPAPSEARANWLPPRLAFWNSRLACCPPPFASCSTPVCGV